MSVIRTLQRTTLNVGRRLPPRWRRWILTRGGRQNYFHPLARVSHILGKRDAAWEDIRPSCSVLTPTIRKTPGTGRYVDLVLAVSLDWQQTRRYEHGTIGIEYGDTDALGQLVVHTFRQTFADRLETVRVRMPAEVEAATYVRIRVLPAPHCERGRYKVAEVRLVDDPEQTHALTRTAELDALKERARNLAAAAEAAGSAICEHYPVALTFELTPACNLTCSHCSAHGESELHRYHNKMPELSLEDLEALAHEVFPSLDVISVVGRGEPFVLKDTVWNRFVELVIQYRVRLAITSNGYFLQRRLTPELLPLIESINFSMDGATPETFALNRGGASIDRVWENVRFYHSLRMNSGLLRSPRLHFAWTLKRNNVAELPDFVRKIATFDADVLTTRHLLIFFPKEKDQSLLEMAPAEANRPMAEAYALLEQFGIRRDCVPLFPEPVIFEQPEPSADAPSSIGDQPSQAVMAEEHADRAATEDTTDPLPNERCMFIHRMPVIMAGGEVMACAVPGAVHVGTLGESATFNDIWNGELFADIRAKLNTAHEWPQCRTCHYREARTSSQRDLAANEQRYDTRQRGSFSREALDFAEPDGAQR